MSSDLKDYIKEGSLKIRKNNDSFMIFRDIPVYIKDPLPDNVDILQVLTQVEDRIPIRLTNGIEGFYVGFFKEFEERNINAMYRDGAIFVTNEQDNNDDMVDDLIHEIAHAVEDLHAQFIYSDNRIQSEFIGKRIRLRDMLQEYGYLDNHENLDFEDLEYNSELDNYLYKELGYDKLETFVNGLFIAPYATISVREYFATAFEDCLLKDPSYVRKISPMAYIKIESLLKREV